MISKFITSNIFSIATIEALKLWADNNLINEIEPPSGSVSITLETIWNDSYYPPQQFPCGHNEWGYDYLMRNETPSRSFQPSSRPHVDWTKSNVYWEVCERAVNDNSCAFSQNQATNTAVQVAGCSYYYLRNGVWETLRENDLPYYGHVQRNPPAGAPYKQCTNPDIQEWMDADRNKEIYYNDKEGVDCYKPHGAGSFSHPWSTSKTISGGTSEITAVCVQQYARLVQIDKDLPNDFHLAEYVTYCGTDAKNSAGANVWKIAVQGHFRSIAKTGEWVPFGVVAGIATWDDFIANPPPLCPVAGLPMSTDDTGSRR